MARFLARWAVPALGAAAVVAGLILLTQSPTQFGWYAYSPLSDATFSPDFVSWPTFVTGIAFVILGVAVIAGWIGYRLGRRAK